MGVLAVRCVNNSDGEFDHLTVDRVYALINKGDNSVLVKDDSGNERYYGVDKFDFMVRCLCNKNKG